MGSSYSNYQHAADAVTTWHVGMILAGRPPLVVYDIAPLEERLSADDLAVLGRARREMTAAGSRDHFVYQTAGPAAPQAVFLRVMDGAARIGGSDRAVAPPPVSAAEFDTVAAPDFTVSREHDNIADDE